jgi:hypothetical protein
MEGAVVLRTMPTSQIEMWGTRFLVFLMGLVGWLKVEDLCRS